MAYFTIYVRSRPLVHRFSKTSYFEVSTYRHDVVNGSKGQRVGAGNDHVEKGLRKRLEAFQIVARTEGE